MNLSGNGEIKAAVFDMRTVGNSILNGGIYGIEASVVTAIVLAVTVIILFVIINRKGRMTVNFMNFENKKDSLKRNLPIA